MIEGKGFPNVVAIQAEAVQHLPPTPNTIKMSTCTFSGWSTFSNLSPRGVFYLTSALPDESLCSPDQWSTVLFCGSFETLLTTIYHCKIKPVRE